MSRPFGSKNKRPSRRTILIRSIELLKENAMMLDSWSEDGKLDTEQMLDLVQQMEKMEEMMTTAHKFVNELKTPHV